jgi:5'-nucleotidase (lipoprotein e(P4) family)
MLRPSARIASFVFHCVPAIKVPPTGLWLAVLIAVAPFSAVGQTTDLHQDRRFDALTWVQNSAEYRMLTEQTFRLALHPLITALNDPSITADEAQLAKEDFADKPPAIILDCDETVLDNSAYAARNILENESYSTETWNAWCMEVKADAIPGSLEFVTRAKALGVEIFFITNRRDVVKDATVENLKKLGFPASTENVMTKNEELGRGDDKVSRRARVAKNHRIIMLIGDSMSDLCSGMNVSETAQRNQTGNRKFQQLGARWIMLPNPIYGGWQQALPADEKALKPKLPKTNTKPSPSQ